MTCDNPEDARANGFAGINGAQSFRLGGPDNSWQFSTGALVFFFLISFFPDGRVRRRLCVRRDNHGNNHLGDAAILFSRSRVWNGTKPLPVKSYPNPTVCRERRLFPSFVFHYFPYPSVQTEPISLRTKRTARHYRSKSLKPCPCRAIKTKLLIFQTTVVREKRTETRANSKRKDEHVAELASRKVVRQ